MNLPLETSKKPCAVSVIIVNWNTRQILHDCLASIAEQTTLPLEIIVVDNASTDGSPEMVAEAFPDAVLIANDENRGFAAGNNQGLSVSRGEKILLLNPDTIILDRAIDKMCAWLDNHPDVGCVGCQVLEDQHTIQRTCFADPGLVSLTLVEFGLMRLAPRSVLLGYPEYGNWNRDTERDVDVVSGMFMLVPRPVFENVGLLDEAFFIYSEEADWCRRIRNAGYRCVFTPAAQIIHLDGGSKSTEQINSEMYVQMQKSKTIYVRKHLGWLGGIAARAIFVTSAVLRGGLAWLAGLRHSTEQNKARMRLSSAALRYHFTGKGTLR